MSYDQKAQLRAEDDSGNSQKIEGKSRALDFGYRIKGRLG